MNATDKGDIPDSGGSMLRQATAGTWPLPPVLPPELAAQELGSCTLLLLNLNKSQKRSGTAERYEDDEDVQVGLDCALWRVGSQFYGVKCIQPGCHLLYSRINQTEVSAADFASHGAATATALAAEDAAEDANDARNNSGAPLSGTDVPGAPVVVDSAAEASQAMSQKEGGFECMYTAMRVEEAIGDVDRDKRGGLQQGEFIYMEPYAVYVRKWDKREKRFVCLTDKDEEQRYINGVKRLEFDRKLGVYPQQFRRVWSLLTDFISHKCLGRLEPLSRSFSSAALPLSSEDELGLQQLQQQQQQQQHYKDREAADIVMDVGVLEVQDKEKELRARQRQAQEKEIAMHFYFTEIPLARPAAVAAARRAEARAKHCGATPEAAAAAAAAALTEAAVDRSDTLFQVLKKINERLEDLEDAYLYKQRAAAVSRRTVAEYFYHCAPSPQGAASVAAAAAAVAVESERRQEEQLWRSLASSEACQDLLGELQLSFLTFLFGQRYDGFEQWKQILLLLSQCARAVRLLPEFYASVLRVFYCQIEQCPDDLLQDPLLQRSFLVDSAASLVNICSNVTPMDKDVSVNIAGRTTEMELSENDETPVDCAERMAMLQRVEQRAAWLQQLLSRTFGGTVDPVAGLLPTSGIKVAATAAEQLQGEGHSSSVKDDKEEDGPVVVDESELLRAGIVVDDDGNFRCSSGGNKTEAARRAAAMSAAARDE